MKDIPIDLTVQELLRQCSIGLAGIASNLLVAAHSIDAEQPADHTEAEEVTPESSRDLVDVIHNDWTDSYQIWDINRKTKVCEVPVFLKESKMRAEAVAMAINEALASPTSAAGNLLRRWLQ